MLLMLYIERGIITHILLMGGHWGNYTKLNKTLIKKQVPYDSIYEPTIVVKHIKQKIK